MAAKHVKTKVAIVGAGPVGLLTSRLLAAYRVPHILIERRTKERKHPQAHYLNMRTMEILRAHMWRAFQSSSQQSPPSTTWRDFVYCHSLTGKEYARIDHFREEERIASAHNSMTNQCHPGPSTEWSPTSVLHLPQHTFESILAKEHAQYLQNRIAPNYSSKIQHLVGYEAKLLVANSHQRPPDGKCDLILKQQPSEVHSMEHSTIHVRCDYLVAADGAHSQIRQQLNIPMEGPQALQHLMNVHFRCPGLKNHLSHRPGMLYFVFNSSLVAVFVSHNPLEDEWVAQIPFFPPFQSPSDFTEAEIKRLLSAAIFNVSSATEAPCRLELLHINSWVMNAQVAQRLSSSLPQSTSSAQAHNNIFLVGDAAHRFPPAGGFGMNSGLQDAHNIAWKLAYAVYSDEKVSLEHNRVEIEAAATAKTEAQRWLAESYHEERHFVAKENTAFSLRNFTKTSNCAAALGLDPELAKLALSMSDNSVTRNIMPMFVRKQMFLKALETGLSSLKGFDRWDISDRPSPLKAGITDSVSTTYAKYRVEKLRHLVSHGGSLPLIFPEQDIGLAYPTMKKGSQSSVAAGRFNIVGKRIVHSWISLDHIEDSPCKVISTVDLPAVLNRLRQQTVMVQNDDMSSSPPPFLLLFPSSCEIDHQSITTDIRPHIIPISVRECSEDEKPLSNDLQRQFQAPHLISSEDDRNLLQSRSNTKSFSSGNHKIEEKPAFDENYLKDVKDMEMLPFEQYSMSKDGQQVVSRLFDDMYVGNSNVPIEVVTICDHAGRLFDQLKQNGMMLVRPDGHVQATLGISPSNQLTSEEISRWLEKELFFLMSK